MISINICLRSSIYKDETPEGDENTLIELVRIGARTIYKDETPEGDENSSGISYISVVAESFIKMRPRKGTKTQTQ